MLDHPSIARVERNGYMQSYRPFMGSKCKCGSTATREFRGKPLCMWCDMKLRSEAK